MKKILILQMRPEDETCKSEFEAILKVGQINRKEAEQVRVERLDRFDLDLNHNLDIFKFKSYRQPNFTFGLTFYIRGVMDSRISTCCEYKHRHGVRLGGDRGHFGILSVDGSKSCIKYVRNKEEFVICSCSIEFF